MKGGRVWPDCYRLAMVTHNNYSFHPWWAEKHASMRNMSKYEVYKSRNLRLNCWQTHTVWTGEVWKMSPEENHLVWWSSHAATCTNLVSNAWIHGSNLTYANSSSWSWCFNEVRKWLCPIKPIEQRQMVDRCECCCHMHFQHDNVPCHKKKKKHWIPEHGNVLQWSPESPDLSPIKHVWNVVEQETECGADKLCSHVNMYKTLKGIFPPHCTVPLEFILCCNFFQFYLYRVFLQNAFLWGKKQIKGEITSTRFFIKNSYQWRHM